MEERNIYVVGAYEDFRCDVFPTHVSPIIAERVNGQFRRWIYSIESPYKITLEHPAGNYFASPKLMFPYLTYQTHDPVSFLPKCQIIALSSNTLLISQNKIYLIVRVAMKALNPKSGLPFFWRSLITIKNIMS